VSRTRTYHDDTLKLHGADVPISILVKVLERLTQSLALVALDELGEFVV